MWPRGHRRRSASSLRERCHFAGHEDDPDRLSADMRHVRLGTFAKVLELLADGGDQLATSHRHCGASLMHGRCQTGSVSFLRGEICIKASRNLSHGAPNRHGRWPDLQHSRTSDINQNQYVTTPKGTCSLGCKDRAFGTSNALPSVPLDSWLS